MPIYEYRCRECAATYEVLHLGRETAADVVCPSCGSHQATRLISAPAGVAIKQESECSPSDCRAGGGCCGGDCGLD